IAQEANEALTIIGLVAAGLGVSVLPASFQRIRIDGVRFLTLQDKDATTAVWLVKRRQEQSPLAQAFMELVTREASAQR
ncbi:MAG TPA: LysR family transcriptional regulator, partial [Pseudomonas sp.]|nr:LysR family transcriptional regulator [Pseudomonas sp.]